LNSNLNVFLLLNYFLNDLFCFLLLDEYSGVSLDNYKESIANISSIKNRHFILEELKFESLGDKFEIIIRDLIILFSEEGDLFNHWNQ
jgi:hypothetical protein